MGFSNDCCSKRRHDFRDKCPRKDDSDVVICVDGKCFSVDSPTFKKSFFQKKRFFDDKHFTFGDWSW